MSRHRGVRNRQFSFDEGEDDYYDDDEEADAAVEAHRQSMLRARGEAADGAASGSASGSGSMVSLSSYFDIPDSAHKQKPQPSGAGREDSTPGGTEGGTFHIGDADGVEASTGNEEEDELVTAIAGELGRRVGKDTFTPNQFRRAVMESGFEVDVAEAILMTLNNQPSIATGVSTAAITRANTTTNATRPPPPGFGPPRRHDGASSSPSALAFGLSVEGHGEWKTASNASTGLPPGFSSHATGGGGAGVGAVTFAPSTGTGDEGGVKPFAFDTPSPDDLNLYKRTGAGRISGAGSAGGGSSSKDSSVGTTVGHGTPLNGGGGKGRGADGLGCSGRKTSVTTITSPKAKVVHIGTGFTPTNTARKSMVSPTRGPGSGAVTPTRGGGSSRDQSPTGGALQKVSPTIGGGRSGGSGAKAMAQLEAAEGADESDEEETGGKERLAMVVIGHVDAGKSTLMGQLLVQLGQVTQRALHKQEKEAREAGKASFFLAWVMDEDQEERAHGVTIDVAQKYVETEHKLVTLLDAPGHRDFIPKMIGGASAADVAVLVIPASVGEFESGFQANGQTKEHAMLAKALGVNQLLVVVNKLDSTDPPWSQERYDAVKAEVNPFLTRTGFRPKKVRFVPASGLSSENVSKRDPNGLLSRWYDGPTVLEAIDAFSPAPRATDKAFRMCVADVIPTGKGVSVSGRVVQGRVRTGDKVVVMPWEDPATVTRLERNGAPARSSRAGDNAELALSGVDASRVVVGNVVCKAGGSRVAIVRRFNAQIVALPELEVPVIKGSEFQMHMHNLDVMVHCSKLVSLTNSSGEVLKARPRCVPSGSTAQIRITCSRLVCLEKYGDCRALGRFVLRQKGATVAVGLVLDPEPR